MHCVIINMNLVHMNTRTKLHAVEESEVINMDFYYLSAKDQLKKLRYYYRNKLIDREQYIALSAYAKMGAPDEAERKLQMILGRRFRVFKDDE